MTTYNHLRKLYKEEFRTLREVETEDGPRLVSDVDEEIEAANAYAFGGDGTQAALQAWNILTEDMHIPR